MKKRHLITDFDGVIGDTADMNYDIVYELHPEVTRQQFADNHNGNVYEEPTIPFTTESWAKYFELYNERLALEHIAAAIPHIHRLHASYHQHVVSSNCESAISRVMREAGVTHMFEDILGKEAHASKVVKLKNVLQKHGILPDDTLFITDTVGDIKEAKKVGLRTVAVTFGYHPRELLAKHEPTALADTWDEALAHIERLLPSPA